MITNAISGRKYFLEHYNQYSKNGSAVNVHQMGENYKK
jgi:hypothetical protein